MESYELKSVFFKNLKGLKNANFVFRKPLTACWRKNAEKQLAKVKNKALEMGCSSLKFIHSYLESEKEKIAFVHGIGHRKSP